MQLFYRAYFPQYVNRGPFISASNGIAARLELDESDCQFCGPTT